jgi:hypothetical protein
MAKNLAYHFECGKRYRCKKTFSTITIGRSNEAITYFKKGEYYDFIQVTAHSAVVVSIYGNYYLNREKVWKYFNTTDEARKAKISDFLSHTE